MRIKTSAPTRIDLAGGTLDLYPLYLFEDGGLTINCAIDMYCTVELETREDSKICLKSLDLGLEEEYENVETVSTDGALQIISRAVRFFRPGVGLNIVTENHLKKGSGLGASSSLLIAALGALDALTDSGYSFEQLIDFAANLEAQCIGVPTGKQDYFAAVFGGVSGLWFELHGNRRECLLSDDADIRQLEDRLILSFTGTPRFSGATNWNMIRNYIDEKPDTVAGMKHIKEIAFAMHSCIIDREWERFADIVDREWQKRRTLAEGVSNERVETIMAAALKAGALANKLCGAGGGGCMITCIRPEDRRKVETALAAEGAEVLPFRIVGEGLKIERVQ